MSNHDEIHLEPAMNIQTSGSHDIDRPGRFLISVKNRYATKLRVRTLASCGTIYKPCAA